MKEENCNGYTGSVPKVMRMIFPRPGAWRFIEYKEKMVELITQKWEQCIAEEGPYQPKLEGSIH